MNTTASNISVETHSQHSSASRWASKALIGLITPNTQFLTGQIRMQNPPDPSNNSTDQMAHAKRPDDYRPVSPDFTSSNVPTPFRLDVYTPPMDDGYRPVSPEFTVIHPAQATFEPNNRYAPPSFSMAHQSQVSPRVAEPLTIQHHYFPTNKSIDRNNATAVTVASTTSRKRNATPSMTEVSTPASVTRHQQNASAPEAFPTSLPYQSSLTTVLSSFGAQQAPGGTNVGSFDDTAQPLRLPQEDSRPVNSTRKERHRGSDNLSTLPRNIRQREVIQCERCGSQVNRGSLLRHQTKSKCARLVRHPQVFPTPETYTSEINVSESASPDEFITPKFTPINAGTTLSESATIFHIHANGAVSSGTTSIGIPEAGRFRVVQGSSDLSEIARFRTLEALPEEPQAVTPA
ncbi:hypothetical protein DOTSEDRAFT_29724 [Dothistroma septosporum NZE10]|uniref:Uncharacterized protein n=1 Tax=Dothistroma septosporum (strain NZE10 / CBS 128990) TaxID=675120 RepID=M2YHY0_DOTSN|nr:hypothetical protein DOTSEDRAFT_29724 [Dothistroma septosporum NZE10]